MKPDERGFEDAIAASLVESGGYRVCKWGTKPEWAADFNPRLGLDKAELLASSRSTAGRTESSNSSATASPGSSTSGASRPTA